MSKPLIFLGVNLKTLNWQFWLYVVLSILAVIGAAMKLYPMGMPRTVIVVIGIVLVTIFYAYRWFGDSGLGSSSWPPTVNMCPDYLTYVPKLPGTQSTHGCVDMLGVSKNGNLQKTLPSDLSSSSAIASNKVITVTSTDVTNATTEQQAQSICNICQRAGITWEGVYDGDVCLAISVVKAKAADAAAGKCS
jgi:hypothetical protein